MRVYNVFFLESASVGKKNGRRTVLSFSFHRPFDVVRQGKKKREKPVVNAPTAKRTRDKRERMALARGSRHGLVRQVSLRSV